MYAEGQEQLQGSIAKVRMALPGTASPRMGGAALTVGRAVCRVPSGPGLTDVAVPVALDAPDTEQCQQLGGAVCPSCQSTQVCMLCTLQTAEGIDEHTRS